MSGEWRQLNNSGIFYFTTVADLPSAIIGPFGNGSNSLITNQTIYVKFAIEGDVLSFVPSDPTLDLNVVPILLDPLGNGVLYCSIPGNYTIVAMNGDGSYIGMQDVAVE